MADKSIDNAFTAGSPLGAASDPTYAGALSFMRRRFTKDVEGSDVTVWGIPFDASVSNRPGTRFGPQALRRASAIFDNDPQYPFHADFFETLSVVDYGDCLLDYRLPERAHPDYRGEQSLNVIANAAFTGIDHPGRAYLALSGYFRHEGVAPEKASPMLRGLAGPRLFDRARLVGALLRVAFPVSAGMAGPLARMPVTVEDGKVVLRLPRDWEALNGERLLNRVRGLARVIGLDGRIDVA